MIIGGTVDQAMISDKDLTKKERTGTAGKIIVTTAMLITGMVGLRTEVSASCRTTGI
jgi:hypothetical protein